MWHEMQGSVLIVRRDLIENDPETVRRLVMVTGRATTWINENPDDSALILAKDLDTDPEVIRRSMERLNYTTAIDSGSVQDVIDFMVELGYVGEDTRAEDMLDMGFLEGASV
jgi:NitT/TauT family transport system substrate-binding protein